MPDDRVLQVDSVSMLVEVALGCCYVVLMCSGSTNHRMGCYVGDRPIDCLVPLCRALLVVRILRVHPIVGHGMSIVLGLGDAALLLAMGR